jgi:hypothetical protein
MHKDLAYLAAQVKIGDDDTFSIADRQGLDFDSHVVGDDNVANGDESLVDAASGGPEARLAAFLYRSCYVQPLGARNMAADHSVDRDFQAALVRSNLGSGSWESGWTLAAKLADNSLLVKRGGVHFRTVTVDVLSTDGCVVGELCTVRTPKERRSLLPGSYLMLGDNWPGERSDQGVITRLYWHLTSKIAPEFVEIVSDTFNRRAIPFSAKVIARPTDYQRADAGVLYLAKADFDRARIPIEIVYKKVESGLRDSVPLFTKRIARGLAAAEDPGGGLSFGQHRCNIVATALMDVHRKGHPDTGANTRAIDAFFRREGLDPDFPFLSSVDSQDCYSFPGRVWPISAVRVEPSATPSEGDRRGAGAGERELLAAAVRIGKAICSQAIWDRTGSECNWIGRVSEPPTSRWSGLATAPLSPDFYEGVSGIAFFLTELFAATEILEFRDTAEGAMKQALRRFRDRQRNNESTTDFGLFTGVIGAAVSASRLAFRTGRDQGSREWLELIEEVMPPRNVGGSNDIISGRAGAILALLSLGRFSGKSRVQEWVLELGEDMRLTREVGRGPDEDARLTGLSHGAAGIGLALLTLYAETNQDCFLVAGREVLEWEDSLFDPRTGNWPDLRRQMPGSPPAFAVAWCHGAPGIALSRLRASELDAAKKEVYLARARSALTTTSENLERRTLQHYEFDATPCHGAIGLMEVLLTGSVVLRQPAYRIAAEMAARNLLKAEDWWASGTICGGPTPSFMTGTAGIGYHFLRFYDTDHVPSVLSGVFH